MSSKKNHSGGNRKSDQSSGRKGVEGKKLQKESYNQKNYKSSPTLSSSTSGKSTSFHHNASSKPSDGSASNCKNNDGEKSDKGEKLVNTHPHKKDSRYSQNLPAEKEKCNIRNESAATLCFNSDRGRGSQRGRGSHRGRGRGQGTGRQFSGSNIASPQFMAMTMQQSGSQLTAKPPQQLHDNAHQNNFQQSGAKPKRNKELKLDNSTKPVKQNLKPVQNKLPVTQRNFGQGNVRFQGTARGNQHITFFSPGYSFHQNNPRNNQQTPSYRFSCNNKQLQSQVSMKTIEINPFFSEENSALPIKYKKKKPDFKNQNHEQRKVNRGHFNKGRRQNKKTGFCPKAVKEFDTSNATPLLSFQSVSAEPESSTDLIHFSDDDDDDWCTISQSSLNETANLIDFSDDTFTVSQPPINASNLIDISDISVASLSVDNKATHISSDEQSDSDLDEESEESDLTSEFSVDSSIVDSEMNILKQSVTKEESFISVFWDIENCHLPSEKSPVDFASYVRRTFYEGCTEVTFTAVCDVSSLKSTFVRELDEAAITLIHVSSQNKNAADKKIMSLLQRFQIQYRKSNSAIVLISSDSDFSQILLDMHYQHHIFVNLICKSNTRNCLTTAANKYVFFESVLDELPDRDVKNDMQHVLIVSNLPEMKFQLIKNSLSLKLRSFNCKIKYENASVVKIIFRDHSICEKAMASLKGFYLGGNALSITYQKELKEIETTMSKKEKKEKKNLKSLNANTNEIDVSQNMKTKSQMTEELGNKYATLCICVNAHAGDVEYWKNVFEKTWNNSDFSIHWDNTFGGCFLIGFKSLKKAQKAKKILQKNQINDPLAPKFLKLIKQEEDIMNLNIVSDLEEQNKIKIDEHLQIIEKKKLKILRKHENIMNELKHQASSEINETTEAINEKLKECKEQMETFKNFCNIIVNAIKLLDCKSDKIEQKLKEFLCDFTRECNCITAALPVYAKKEEILRKIREHQVIIIRAETGSGKSTQLTQYIWREVNNFHNGIIICTQPRKIAAVSLAKHVCSQIGSSLGDIVGYQVGMCNKMSESTRILYVTDFTMLKILINGDLAKVSCIIVDEAHERTIYTDILLGMIKQYLPSYPHLRVVITSATIDTSIFRDYFSLTDSAVLHISGRIFPVEDTWLDFDITPDCNYFTKVVDKALEILTEDPGDVLAFLTTPIETEKALENFNEKLKGSKSEKNVKVFCLHGKMNSEEQQKVFEKTPNGVRKVIFATNCAETSITIPGVKYVIDCGLVKESQYDAVRNMNVLSVCFVSKSAAEQRRGRAGRTQVGKCYRLYSKKNYDSMANNTSPEILRTNLGQALLKLLKLGVNNPLQFDFIQSPPKELLTSAMDQLLFLNAVDANFILTDLGMKMAVLPLDPRLCHLTFLGFDNNIGYDALVAAALITMSHTIFFRSFENKDEADKKKRRFCESESDFISYLAVYKEWADVPKNLKSQWCVLNCINARAMRTVHELVNEIILILQKELNFKVNLKFSSESTYDALSRIILYSFSQNLSVFSGHPKYGYKCLNASEGLLIHPSSSLSAFGQSTPEFVVYETVLKTTRTYIVNVNPVTRDMLMDAINLYNLKIDLGALESLTGTVFYVCPIGERILLSNFIGKKGVKRKELQRKLKEFTNSDFIEIDIDVSKGSIQIFGFGYDVSEMESFISSLLYHAQQSLLNEEKDICLHEEGRLTAILSAGGHITDVILPDEFRDLKIVLRGQEAIESVCEKLSLCGPITEIREWNKYFKVTFKIPASAKKALDCYSNESEFSLQRIHKYIPVNERDYLYKVFMSFLRRPCVGKAYFSVEPQISASVLPAIKYEDVRTTLSISKKSSDICIVGLPENTDKKKLESLVSDVLPSGVKITKCIVLRKKPYESTEEEMGMIKNHIIELFAEFTFKENITIFLKKPVAKDFCWNATIYFKNSLDGEIAVNVLRNRKVLTNFVGGFVLKPELQTYLCCKSEIFSVVKEEIEEALEFYKKDQSAGSILNINAVPKGQDTVEIKIMSNNIRDINDARRCIHEILSGDELKFPDSSFKAKLFSYSGKEVMKKLSLEFQNCYILQNEYNKTVSIFGKETSRNVIKMRINEFLHGLRDDNSKELSLKTDSGKTGVFKELLKKYGYDLQKLKGDCDLIDVEVNKYKQILTIRGNPSSVAKCESIIKNIKEELDANCSEVGGEVCPVCYDEVSEDKHRLQYCGHAYCTECLLHLFQSSENIPLNCESCQESIVLSDIFWAVNGRKPLEKVLFEKFLHSFVASRDDISFCPSPDCAMVYRVTDGMNIFKCPCCGNSICTSCGDIFHFGMSCGLYKCLKSDVDASLEVWMKEDTLNHKKCPKCSSPIEKNGGCNHMTCWKCSCHMCWLCLAVFPTGLEVYDHQSKCPMNNPLMRLY